MMMILMVVTMMILWIVAHKNMVCSLRCQSCLEFDILEDWCEVMIKVKMMKMRRLEV